MKEVIVVKENNHTLVAGKAGCGKSRIIADMFIKEYKENMDNCVGILIDSILSVTPEHLQFMPDCYHDDNKYLYCSHLEFPNNRDDAKSLIKNTLKTVLLAASTYEAYPKNIIIGIISEKFYGLTEDEIINDIIGDKDFKILDIIEGIQLGFTFDMSMVSKYIIDNH